jgi:hypothetical protein
MALLTLAEMQREEETMASHQTTEHAKDVLKLAIFNDTAKLYQQVHLHNVEFFRCNARVFVLVSIELDDAPRVAAGTFSHRYTVLYK